MIKVETNAKQFLEKAKKNVMRLKEATEKATLKEALRIQAEIRIEWPVSTGESRQQIIIREVERNGVTGYQVVANTDYAKYIDNIDPNIEFVRRPGAGLPPLDNIANWARKKGIVSGGSYDALQGEEKSTVFLIARAIARRGIKNAKIFFTVLDRNKNLVTKNITQEIARLLK